MWAVVSPDFENMKFINHNRKGGSLGGRSIEGWPEGRGSGNDQVKGHRGLGGERAFIECKRGVHFAAHQSIGIAFLFKLFVLRCYAFYPFRTSNQHTMKPSSFLKKLSALSLLLFLGLMSSVMAVYTGSNNTYTLTDSTVPGEINGYTGTLPAHLVIPLKNDTGISITKINASVFKGVSTITTLTLPTSLIEIGVDAFKDCDNLYSVFIPDNVTTIGIGAFADCDKLVSITSANNSARYATEDGVLYDITGVTATLLQYPAGRPDFGFDIPSTISAKIVDVVAERAFEGNKYLLSINFDNNVTTVGEKAFFNYQSLARVIFDTGVTNIGANAFTYNGTGNGTLAHATFLGNQPGTIGSTPFAKAASTFEVRFIQGSTGFTAPTWTTPVPDTYNSRIIRQTTNDELTYRINAGSVEILSVGTTANATLSIPQVIDGLPVRYVAPLAFVGDPALTSVQLPTSLTTIGQDAFYGCTLLDSVGLLPTVSVLDIPANIISLGVGAFGGCPLLAFIEVSNANNNYQAVDNVLYDKSLTHVVQFPINGSSSYQMPGTVQYIDERAFEGNTSLTTIELGIGQKVTEIGKRAFYNNTSLVTVRFGIKIQKINDEAFACALGALDEAIFYGNAPTMGINVFRGAPSTFTVSRLPSDSTFTPGSGTWTPNPGESYTLIDYTQDSDFKFDVKADNSIEITGYVGTPPDRGQNPLGKVRIDYTQVSDPTLVVADQTARLALANTGPPIQLDVGQFVQQSDTGAVYVVVSKTEAAPAGPATPPVVASVEWEIEESDGQQLTLNTNYALGTTVLVQDSVGPKVWQKVAFPGTNATDWIEVNFGIPDTIAARPVTSIKGRVTAGNGTVTSPGAFEDNDLIASMVLPASLSEIGVDAFYDCDKLGFLTAHAVFIPASVTTIGDGAFSACSILESFFVHTSNPKFSSLDGVLFDKGQGTLLCYPAGAPVGSYTIPGTVKYIENQAFQDNENIVTIEFSDTIETIGQSAFADSQRLVQVIVGKGITTIGSNAFSNIRTLASAVFNGNAPITIGTNVFYNAANGFKIEYYNGYSGWVATTPGPATPTQFNTYTINARRQLGDFTYEIITINGTTTTTAAEIIGYVGSGGNVTIPAAIGVNPVRSIGVGAFKNKTNIVGISLPSTISEIKDNAFQGASNLTSITFGSGLIYIRKDAFTDCDALTTITIPPSVTTIGAGAFSSCDKLTAINVDLNNPTYRSVSGVVFDKSQKILYHYPAGKPGSSYVTPVTLLEIKERAFEGNVYIAQVEISSRVTTIEKRAFYNTLALASAQFGVGVKTIGEEAFAGIVSPLISAKFFGSATGGNFTMNGTGIFGGALPDFTVYCLTQYQSTFANSTNGTKWKPATNSSIDYKLLPITQLADFEFVKLPSSNSTIEITKYVGLAPQITPDFTISESTIDLDYIISNFAAWSTSGILGSVPIGSFILDRSTNTIYVVVASTEGDNGRIGLVYTRVAMSSTYPLGNTVLDQDGKVYQKIANPGTNYSDWIEVDFKIPEEIGGMSVASINATAFDKLSGITSVVLPKTLKTIAPGAFQDCDALTAVFLPSSLSSFGAGAFSNCDRLQGIYVDTANAYYMATITPDVHAGVLFDKTMKELVLYPAGRLVSEYETPSTVKTINESAFSGNMYLNLLRISGSCTSIEKEAFRYSQSLTKVLVGSGVESIGESAFANLSSLALVIFQGDAPELEVGGFEGVFADTPLDLMVRFYPGTSGWDNDIWKNKYVTAIGNWNSGLYKTTSGFRLIGNIDQANFNSLLGGKMDLTVSRSGMCTGTISILGDSGTAVTHRFRKGVDDDGKMSVSIYRRGEADMQLNLQFELDMAPTFFELDSGNSTLKVGNDSAKIDAKMLPWNTIRPAASYGGKYNVGLELLSQENRYGFLSINITPSTGALKLAGVLPDGALVTGSSFVTGLGSVPVWIPLYSKKGMLLGNMEISSSVADGKPVTASLSWSKPPDVPLSTDPDGFDNLTLVESEGSGALIAVSATDIKNTKLAFYDEDGTELEIPSFQSAWNLQTGIFRGRFKVKIDNFSSEIGLFQGVVLPIKDAEDESLILFRGNYQKYNTTSPTVITGGSVQNPL